MIAAIRTTNRTDPTTIKAIFHPASDPVDKHSRESSVKEHRGRNLLPDGGIDSIVVPANENEQNLLFMYLWESILQKFVLSRVQT